MAKTARHAAIKSRVLEKAGQFKARNGYVPPYWELLRTRCNDDFDHGLLGWHGWEK